MTTISAQEVKELRERTGISMMECKKALIETNWDMDLAIEELRKKGLAKAAKKADRDTSEWAIKIEVIDNKAYIIAISCETDFLANSANFKKMLSEVLEFLKKNGEDSRQEAQEMINREFSLELWENLQIKEYKIITWNKIWAYVHSNWKLASIVSSSSSQTDQLKLTQIAMHVTASNPEYLSKDDIWADIIEKEKLIQLDIMKNDPKMANKPEEVLLKIIEWKIDKFKAELSLLEQDFVMDPNLKVKDFIWENTLSSFIRFSI